MKQTTKTPYEKGESIIGILHVLVSRSENLLKDRKREVSNLLKLSKGTNGDFGEILACKERKDQELLEFVSDIKERIGKLSYEEILKDLKESEFCNTFIEKGFKRSGNIYNQVMKIFIGWLKKTNLLTSGEKGILFHELDLCRKLIELKNEGLLVPYIDGMLNILNFLGLNIFGRNVLTTESFRQYISCKIDKENKEYYLGMMDIDNFKSINDIFGHQVGDLVLSEIFKQLNDKVGGGFWFRYGGEEIGLVVNEDFFKQDRVTEFDIKIDNIGNGQIKLIRNVQSLILEKLQDGEKVYFTNLGTLEKELKNDSFQKTLEVEEKSDKEGESQSKDENLLRYFEKNGDVINCYYVSGKRTVKYHRYIKGETMTITVSIGASKLDEQDFQDTKKINNKTTKADQALYKGKDSGRNKVVIKN